MTNNYIITECLTNNVFVLSGTSYTSGATVSFSIIGDIFCGTVGPTTLSAITPNIVFVSLYNDCCACLSDNDSAPLNFKFIRCNTLEEIDIEANNFCSGHTAPTIGLIYEIQFDTETPFCATFTGLTSTGETNYSYVSGPFSVCEDCENPPPISAGTEYNVCVIDCSGNTVSITPPHPTWTNEQGHAVVLLDAIALGGMNGLNS